MTGAVRNLLIKVAVRYLFCFTPKTHTPTGGQASLTSNSPHFFTFTGFHPQNPKTHAPPVLHPDHHPHPLIDKSSGPQPTMTPSLSTPRQSQSQSGISSSTSTDKTAPTSSSSSSISRLNSIARHISPKMVSTTNFPAEVVPQAPEDPLFGLARAYKADESPNKVDLVSLSLRP
jgi:hypothetical protein